MRWTVGNKIGTAFGITVAIFLIVGISAYRAMDELIEASDERRHTFELVVELYHVEALLTHVQNGQRGYVLTGDDAYLEEYQSAVAEVEQRIQTLRRLTSDNNLQQQRLDRLQPLIDARLANSRDAIEVRRTSGLDAAVQASRAGEADGAVEAIETVLGEIEAEAEERLDRRIDMAESSAGTAKWTLGLGMLVALAFATVAGFLIAQNIAGPLRHLTTVAERITVGDLNVKIESDGRADEVGELARTFDRMTNSLRSMASVAGQIADRDLRSTVVPHSPDDVLGNSFSRMVENLRGQMRELVEGAHILGSAASEIVASTSQLAATASESAAAVGETTTTVEEVRQTAQVASQKAKNVSESAKKAAEFAQTGRRSTEDVSAAMDGIGQQMEAIAASMMRLSEQNQAIGQVIATVEDLAAQSNLLAVNAAMEAAKAGEHGKGFGVVAQEVKSLAEQSRQATTQVRTILNDIQKATTAAVISTEQGSKAVEEGAKQTRSAGEAIQVLAGSVTESAQAATQIAASSQQQVAGVDQVATAMESIKEASAQNVASAKQLETAAQNLSELGRRLKEMVDGYKVGPS